MPRFENVELAGIWNRGVPVLPKRHMRLLDQLASELLNADDGGSWTPSSQIVFGSSLAMGGFKVIVNPSTYTGGSTIVGGVTTRGDGAAISFDPANRPYFRNASDAVDVSRDRTIVEAITSAAHETGVAIGATDQYSEMDRYVAWDADLGELRLLECSVGVNTIRYFVPLTPRRIMQNATLASVTLRWRVTYPRAALPTTQPTLDVLKVAANGTAVSLRASPLSVGAASAATYYNQGNPQDLLYTCTQNNAALPVDSGYHLAWTEESDFGGNALIGVKLAFTANTRLWEV